MGNTIQISRKSTFRGTVKNLASSKSISNRVLILNALAGGRSAIRNLSSANDTRLMNELLTSAASTLDVEDAGTTMRFLTAYCAIQGLEKTITGTDRMKQRPIGILVEALRAIGCEIDFLDKHGFPPLSIKSFKSQLTETVSMRGDVSSQYISAMMMVGPILPKGLIIDLVGKVGSRPYIEMTAALMRKFGAKVDLSDQQIVISASPYKPVDITIEADWSSASYWFAFAALSKAGELLLPGITLRSIQGDAAIVDIMEILGVKAEPRGDGLLLAQKDHHDELTWDFTHCPDLAQTVAVVCAVKGIRGKFTGLESLRIKETDRIMALQNELQKIGGNLVEENGTWTLSSGGKLPGEVFINTYLDHRMAMAFAPLAAVTNVTIENPAVTRKSYPEFWDDVKSLGFDLKEIN